MNEKCICNQLNSVVCVVLILIDPHRGRLSPFILTAENGTQNPLSTAHITEAHLSHGVQERKGRGEAGKTLL